MNKIAFLLTFIAGFSTLIGFFFIFIKGNKDSIICKTLGFASGIMLCISIIDLLPNSIKLINYNIIYMFLCVFMPFLTGLILSYIIGIKINKKVLYKPKLYKIGILTSLIIIIHNIPEGIITYITSNNNIKLGLIITIAISLHNIPEGISISLPIYYSTNSKLQAFIYTFISSISEPLGAYITYLFLYKYINNYVLSIIYSITSGIMINISLNELYKESIIYSKKTANKYLIIGILLILLNHLLFN